MATLVPDVLSQHIAAKKLERVIDAGMRKGSARAFRRTRPRSGSRSNPKRKQKSVSKSKGRFTGNLTMGGRAPMRLTRPVTMHSMHPQRATAVLGWKGVIQLQTPANSHTESFEVLLNTMGSEICPGAITGVQSSVTRGSLTDADAAATDSCLFPLGWEKFGRQFNDYEVIECKWTVTFVPATLTATKSFYMWVQVDNLASAPSPVLLLYNHTEQRSDVETGASLALRDYDFIERLKTAPNTRMKLYKPTINSGSDRITFSGYTHARKTLRSLGRSLEDIDNLSDTMGNTTVAVDDRVTTNPPTANTLNTIRLRVGATNEDLDLDDQDILAHCYITVNYKMAFSDPFYSHPHVKFNS